MDYWTETISQAFDEAGIDATEEQIELVVSHVEGAHENYDMAFGYSAASVLSPLKKEKERLRQELEEEKGRVCCRTCRGTGQIVDHGPSHTAQFDCYDCGGSGRRA